ncbi:hypothetical protein [Pedobacter sp. UYP30]|uniref:hypothetical protein n=1 Tax=Pedobacter sp. UYP30 TaxID=1756400 RepID=UPI003394A6FC
MFANLRTEFYRFQFWDDVSISHFFVTGLFLLAVLVFLIRNHSKERYNPKNLLKIGAILLLIVFLSLTFFISYSFGLNVKLREKFPQKSFNADKTLLNTLNPFLYNYSLYSSEKLFAITNILYPKPYPVIEVTDTTFYDLTNKESYILASHYYSIDTLKMLTSGYENLKTTSNSVFNALGLDNAELQKRIISKKTVKDSTEIVFKGAEVSPRYDPDICMFLRNNTLISPISGISIKKQQRQNAIRRYKLLYKLDKDSLLNSFKKLDTLLKKYGIESKINPMELTRDAFYFRDNNHEQLNDIRNTFDRNALLAEFNMLDSFFYQSNYFDSSIRTIFFSVLFSLWLFGFLIFIIVNFMRKSKHEKADLSI